MTSYLMSGSTACHLPELPGFSLTGGTDGGGCGGQNVASATRL